MKHSNKGRQFQFSHRKLACGHFKASCHPPQLQRGIQRRWHLIDACLSTLPVLPALQSPFNLSELRGSSGWSFGSIRPWGGLAVVPFTSQRTTRKAHNFNSDHMIITATLLALKLTTSGKYDTGWGEAYERWLRGVTGTCQPDSIPVTQVKTEA